MRKALVPILLTFAVAAPPAHATTAALHLTCNVTMPAPPGGNGGGPCSATGATTTYAFAFADAQMLFTAFLGTCGANGSASGVIVLPPVGNLYFTWTWVGTLGVMNVSGAVNGVGLTSTVPVTGSPCGATTDAVVIDVAGT